MNKLSFNKQVFLEHRPVCRFIGANKIDIIFTLQLLNLAEETKFSPNSHVAPTLQVNPL